MICVKVISRSGSSGYFPLISQAGYRLVVRVNNPGSENNLCRMAKPAKHLINLVSGGELAGGGRGFEEDIYLSNRKLDI